jgi:hypothetical protein
MHNAVTTAAPMRLRSHAFSIAVVPAGLNARADSVYETQIKKATESAAFFESTYSAKSRVISRNSGKRPPIRIRPSRTEGRL